MDRLSPFGDHRHPNAPAGALIIGGQAWIADASQGFTPVLATEVGVADPLLAVSAGGLPLPNAVAKLLPAGGGVEKP